MYSSREYEKREMSILDDRVEFCNRIMGLDPYSVIKWAFDVNISFSIGTDVRYFQFFVG